MSESASRADEHPLEALYQARDAAQCAAVNARYVGFLSAERATYENVLGELLVSLGELSAQYRLTFPATAAHGRSAACASHVLTSLLCKLAQARSAGTDAAPAVGDLAQPPVQHRRP